MVGYIFSMIFFSFELSQRDVMLSQIREVLGLVVQIVVLFPKGGICDHLVDFSNNFVFLYFELSWGVVMWRLGFQVETIVLFSEKTICDNLVEFSDDCN